VATWNLGVLAVAIASLIVVGIIGGRAIGGARARGGLLLGAAAAPAIVGAVGAIVHLSRTSAGGEAESVVLLDIEAALAILVYGLDWSAAALLAAHVAAACAKRATVARLDRSIQRARLMTTGRSVAALAGPAFAAFVAFLVDGRYLPNAWDPSWQGPLRTATGAVGAALAVAAATAVPRAGDTRALPDETTAPAVDSAAVAMAVLFLGTALVAWGSRPFERVNLPPAALAGGLGPFILLLIGDAVASGTRPRLASFARGLWSAVLAIATLAVVGWSFVALGRIDWTRASTFPAVVRADSIAVRRIDPGQLELVIGLDVENPLEGPVRAEGATGAAHALGNWSADAFETWDVKVASHGHVTGELRIPLTRDDLALPRDGEGLSIRARGDVVVDDGVHQGKVPFAAQGALTHVDVEWLLTRPTGPTVRR
jgi:hypothetical protein